MQVEYKLQVLKAEINYIMYKIHFIFLRENNVMPL
jgi:hypothetical protein